MFVCVCMYVCGACLLVCMFTHTYTDMQCMARKRCIHSQFHARQHKIPCIQRVLTCLCEFSRQNMALWQHAWLQKEQPWLNHGYRASTHGFRATLEHAATCGSCSSRSYMQWLQRTMLHVEALAHALASNVLFLYLSVYSCSAFISAYKHEVHVSAQHPISRQSTRASCAVWAGASCMALT
jgi:hypothetical protein